MLRKVVQRQYVAELAEAKWGRFSRPPRDLAKGGQREDAHIDLGHKEVLCGQNRGAAEALRVRQARKK